ncbi:integrator complex subunit 1-like isoform X2 [Convolutriloba macropyga]|uniref:integrator complex subunit 1-like isoform X2 n=1 Tax=Convolutriloba macropyga TaxID=536237 RepID=UPI003F51FDC0
MSHLSKRGRNRIGVPGPHNNSSFIALGAGSTQQASTSSSCSSSSATGSKRSGEQGSGDDGSIRKRDHSAAFASLGSDGGDSKASKLSESEAGKLAMQIVKLNGAHDEVQLVLKLTEAIKYVSTNRVSPSEALYSAVLMAFRGMQSPNVLESHPKLMKNVLDMLRDSSWNAGGTTTKQRPNNVAVALCCNILLSCLKSSNADWPIQFIKLFIDDFTQERIWADLNSALTKDFVFNLITSFNTQIVPGLAESLSSSTVQRPRLFVSGGNSTNSLKEESKVSPIGSPIPFLISPNSVDAKYIDRYPDNKDLLCKLVIDSVNEIFARGKAGSGCSLSTNQIDLQQKNAIQLLAVTCGLPGIRHFACSKLEAWLHNTKLYRPSQDLLNAVCLNCSSENALKVDSAENTEIVSMLIRIKPKNKNVGTALMLSIKEMSDKNVEINKVLLRNIVFNEFSGGARNPNNMYVISQMFQSNSILVTTHLAFAFQLVLYQKDDYSKAVRTFLRDIVKSQRLEIKFDQFCAQLLDIQPEVQAKMQAENLQLSKYLISIADLATYALFICLPMNSREVFATAKAKKEHERNSLNLDVVEETQKTVAQIIAHFVEWVKAHSLYFSPEQYNQLMHKMLLFEPLDTYLKQDPYPPDQSTCHRMLIESGVLESCLLNIINMGLDPDYPLNSSNSMNFIEGLVTRSPLNSITIIHAQEFTDQLFKLVVYSKPASISLPPSYEEPKLAVSSLLWKAWTVLLILSGSNVDTVANIGWEKLPMLKMLMEMCLTSDFNYPPSASNVNREELRRYEMRIAEQERNEIISFECHLARKTITADSSLLISQLTYMDPKGPTRLPSPEFLSHLKMICNSLKVGNALCSSRTNDYLLDVLNRNRTLASGPAGSGSSWLSQIIMSSDVGALPPQCLCEFLLMESTLSTSSESHIEKVEMVTQHLESAISENVYSSKVFAYLLAALTSSDDLFRKEAASNLTLQLLKSVIGDQVKHEHLFESVSKALNVMLGIGENLLTMALKTMKKEFDLKLVASALSFAVRQIAMQNVDDASSIILFADIFVCRRSIFERSLKYCNDLSAVFPSCCRIIFAIFSNDTKGEPISSTSDVMTIKGTKLSAPSSVVTCLFSMFLMSVDCEDSLETFPLKELSFDVVKSILPDSLLMSCALRCKTLFSKWVYQMIDISNLVKSLTFAGLSTSLSDTILTRIEGYSLNGIKDALRDLEDHIEALEQDLITNFGPKLECAYTSVITTSVKSRSQTADDIVQEIDEIDVDVLGEVIDDPLNLKDCKDSDSLAMLITQIIVKHPGQSLTLPKLSAQITDYSDVSNALCEVIKVQEVVASLVDNVSVHEFTAFVMNIGKNLGFRQLNKFTDQLRKALSNTKFHRSYKLLNIHVENEEVNMQPKSPEPEEKLSLSSKSLLDQASGKIGYMSQKTFSCTGKLLDLVLISDPETTRKHSDYLWNILFSGKHNFSSYHCFLIANLIHSVSWESVQLTVESLLQNLDKTETTINPTVVLDFITAVQMQPKLFQGRETRLLNKISEQVLCLDMEATSKLLILVYQECAEVMKTDKNYLDLLQSRIVLLLKLQKSSNIDEIVGDLIELCDSFKTERIRKSIQILIYLNTAVPLSAFAEKFAVMKTEKYQNSFQADLTAYNLILPLESLTNFDFDTQHLTSNLILKFASTHPVFANRQLDLLAVLLKGKFRSSWTGFKRDGIADLFKAAVRILLRLAPSAFSHKRFPEIMQTILGTVISFTSLTNEFNRKLKNDIYELIDRYFEYDHILARRAVKNYASFLVENPKKNKHLMNCLGLLETEATGTTSNSNSGNTNLTSCSELEKCRKFFCGSVGLQSYSEEAMCHLKLIEELSHKLDVNLDRIIEPLVNFLQLNLSCSEIVERTLSVILGVCKHKSNVYSLVSNALIKFLLSEQQSLNVSSMLSIYTIDILLVNLSDHGGADLLKSIFDAFLLTNFPESEQQLKKIFRATTLERIFSCSDL